MTIAKSESQRIEKFINTNLFDAQILAKDPLVIKYLKDDIEVKSILGTGYYTGDYLFEHFKGRVDSIHWLDVKGIVLGGVPFVDDIIGALLTKYS